MCDINFSDSKEFLQNCEAIKSQYEEFLSPLFNFEKIRQWKNVVYSLDIPEWKQDKVWEYLNGDVDKELLQKII